MDMAAADHLNTQQYVHMKAGDLANPERTEFGDLELYDDDYEFMRYDKFRNAVKTGLYHDIKRSGVKEPVNIYPAMDPSKVRLDDGHHRVFAAESIDPDMMIPVRRSWADD